MNYVVFCLLAHRLSMMVLCNHFQLETIFETREPPNMLSLHYAPFIIMRKNSKIQTIPPKKHNT